MALGVGAGDRVLTSPFSFFATAGTIARLGATAVFADVEPEHVRPRPRRASRPRRPRGARRRSCRCTSSGTCCDMDALARSRAPRLPILEDAAQAIGARDAHGRRGGHDRATRRVLVLPDEEPRRRRRRRHGGHPRRRRCATRCGCCARTGRRASTSTRVIGGNFRLDAIQAAVLGAALPHLAGADRRRRRENAARYGDAPRGGRAARRARRRARRSGAGHAVHQYVVRVTAGGATRCRPRSRRAASGRWSTTRCRSTCRSASAISVTAGARSPRRSARRRKCSRCRSSPASRRPSRMKSWTRLRASLDAIPRP